jgi:hypothetical protein
MIAPKPKEVPVSEHIEPKHEGKSVPSLTVLPPLNGNGSVEKKNREIERTN